MPVQHRRSIAAGVAAVATTACVAILRVHTSTQCLSLNPGGNTLIRRCQVRPDWATHSAELLAVAAALTAVTLLLSRDLAALLAGLAATAGLAWGLGDLFIHLWAPTATAENSSPPPEAGLFVLGVIVAVAVAALFFVSAFVVRRSSITRLFGVHR